MSGKVEGEEIIFLFIEETLSPDTRIVLIVNHFS